MVAAVAAAERDAGVVDLGAGCLVSGMAYFVAFVRQALAFIEVVTQVPEIVAQLGRFVAFVGPALVVFVVAPCIADVGVTSVRVPGVDSLWFDAVGDALVVYFRAGLEIPFVPDVVTACSETT